MIPLKGHGGGNRRIAIEGQSNSVGQGARASLPADLLILDAATFERVYIFDPATSAYVKLKMGTNNLGNTAATFGPEFGLAVRWMRETLHGDLYIDKHGVNGQPIAYYQSGGAYYTDAVTRLAAQNAWLALNKARAVNMGWLWVQGESDNVNSQAYYEGALATLIGNRVSSGMQGAVDFCVIAQMYTGSSMYNAGIAAAKVAYAAGNPKTAKLITMPNYFNGDNLHSNWRGQLQIGYDAFSRFFSKPTLAA